MLYGAINVYNIFITLTFSKGQGMQQHILIDGDDTLWENNIYFERAIEAFIDFLDHSSLKPEEVRAVLDEIEMTQGYGAANFAKSLQETYLQLAERDVRDEDLERVRRFGEQIMHHPMQVIDGVQETLVYLLPRHRLILLTKGNSDEQRIKIENSGLGIYFEHTIIVAEKDIVTYNRVVQELELDVPHTWMIGNSPRSDINPARHVGLNVVFIPHSHTWHLENQDIVADGPGQLLELASFTELRNHF
jgi:putative hydrolase of the HAD superfamily